jgi:hypothetical protein
LDDGVDRSRTLGKCRSCRAAITRGDVFLEFLPARTAGDRESGRGSFKGNDDPDRCTNHSTLPPLHDGYLDQLLTGGSVHGVDMPVLDDLDVQGAWIPDRFEIKERFLRSSDLEKQ